MTERLYKIFFSYPQVLREKILLKRNALQKYLGLTWGLYRVMYHGVSWPETLVIDDFSSPTSARHQH